MGPTNFLEDMAILSFERQYPKQNRVIRVKSNILPPPSFWAGYATGSLSTFCDCGVTITILCNYYYECVAWVW